MATSGETNEDKIKMMDRVMAINVFAPKEEKTFDVTIVNQLKLPANFHKWCERVSAFNGAAVIYGYSLGCFGATIAEADALFSVEHGRYLEKPNHVYFCIEGHAFLYTRSPHTRMIELMCEKRQDVAIAFDLGSANELIREANESVESMLLTIWKEMIGQCEK